MNTDELLKFGALFSILDLGLAFAASICLAMVGYGLSWNMAVWVGVTWALSVGLLIVILFLVGFEFVQHSRLDRQLRTPQAEQSVLDAQKEWEIYVTVTRQAFWWLALYLKDGD